MFNKRYFYFLCFCFFAHNADAFVVNGVVKSDAGEAIAAASIYEQDKNSPVAKTDESGRFSYETGSDDMVVLTAKKKGWVTESKAKKITKDNAKNLEILLEKFWVKDKITIYAILGDDKNCKINTVMNWDGYKIDEINDYKPSCLGKRGCPQDGTSFIRPNKNGGFTLRNISTFFTIFYSQWIGGVTFFEKPDDVFYYNIDESFFDGYRDPEKVKKEYNNWKQIEGFDMSWADFTRAKKEKLNNWLKNCDNVPDWAKNIDYGTYDGEEDGDIEEYDDEKDTSSGGDSIAKKLIGGVSSAAMGIGAMQMAQGLSEQKADKEAEADMRQYLNTFTCTYGAKAQTVKFGPEDVTLDAGADLVKYATEYRGLAERLKKTKKALNLTPGIEEEEIIDPATSGLYSYTPTEKKDGQYTSLSKAILDEESEDAKEWAAQKSKSKKRVIVGAVALGAGTALSVLNGSGALDKLFSRHNKNGEESETSDVPEEYQEPQNCSFEKCLGMLSVTEDTERTELYSQMKNFCDKNYPNESDCVKVMLIYQMSHFIIEEMDSADNYDFDHYKDSDLIFYCDSNVCVDSPEERYLHLFTDN